MTSKTPKKKCCICGRRVFSVRSIYCLRCFEFARAMDQRGLHAIAVKNIWQFIRKYGFICYYTKQPVDLKNPESPWYFTFDHRTPGDETSVVLTMALVNEMKSDLTEKEFKYTIHELDRCFRAGAKFKKIRLVYWQRLRPPGKFRK